MRFCGSTQMRDIMAYKVAVVMGSDSDLPVVEKTIEELKALEIPYTVQVLSAHRTPKHVVNFAESAKGNGFGVVVAAAGMAAHLAGFIAAHTTLPVIGLPCRSGAMDGLDALLSTVQMPPGVPVATVGLDAGANAGLLAAQMLAITDDALAEKLAQKRAGMEQTIEQKNQNLKL